MDKETVEDRISKLQKEALSFYDKMQDELDYVAKEHKELKRSIERGKEDIEIGAYDTFEVCLSLMKSRLKRKGVEFPFDFCGLYIQKMQELQYMKCLEDSDRIKLSGDLIITDPCYFIKKAPSYFERPEKPDFKMFEITDNEFLRYVYKNIKNEKMEAYECAVEEWMQEYGTDWEKSNGGQDLSILGFKHFLSRDTLYGDWCCSVFNLNSKKRMGTFCSDSGMVCVCLLDEVLAYNPEFNMHITTSDAAAVLKGFDGDVQMKVVENQGVYEEDFGCHKEGETWTDYSVEILGTGNINFVTRQTGF